MPEVLGSPPSPRTALFWNGTGWQWALVDAAGHLQIDTVTSALPAGAATAANQIIINTTVGLVALIRNALQTVDTDRLIVRGEDQLHSYDEPLCDTLNGAISGADGHLDSNDPADGLVWHVTHITVHDFTTATTAVEIGVNIGGVWGTLDGEIRAIGVGEASYFKVDIWLEHDDFVRATFTGGLVADACRVGLIGEVFTKE